MQNAKAGTLSRRELEFGETIECSWESPLFQSPMVTETTSVFLCKGFKADERLLLATNDCNEQSDFLSSIGKSAIQLLSLRSQCIILHSTSSGHFLQ